MIRSTPPLDDAEMVPQAVLARPIFYFTLAYQTDSDDLDFFEGAAFCLNNSTHFCLRHYHGHPTQTVALYLEYQIAGLVRINNLIDEIVAGFGTPKSAVRWRRGDSIDGGLPPAKDERLVEAETRILALKIAASCDNREASTSYIKQKIPNYVALSARDLEPSPSRKRESRWQQVVGNVISHQKASTSIFKRKLAKRTKDGIRVTDAGMDYLNNLGFSLKRRR